MSLHQLRFLMERLWLTAKTCDIFRAIAVNLGIICSNLNQRKSSRWRNSQDLIGIFCSGPFAPLYHALTLNVWAASQRGKSHTFCGLLLAWAERDARGWAGGATQVLWLCTLLWVRHVALGLCGARLQWRRRCLSSLLLPSTATTTLQLQGASGAPWCPALELLQPLCEQKSLWILPRVTSRACGGVQWIQSPHGREALFISVSKGKPFQPSKITFSRHCCCCLHFSVSALISDTDSTKM